MSTAIRISSEYSGDKSAILHYLQQPNQEARFAMELLGRFGLIAARDDGEDSTGRAKMVILPVEETVTRAFDLAAAAFRILRERGMLITLPDPNEINAERDDERAQKKAKEKV